MIVKTDTKHRFWYQLTSWQPTLEDLEMALEPFRNDGNAACCVRKNSEGQYAIFTEGKSIGKPLIQIKAEKKLLENYEVINL